MEICMKNHIFMFLSQFSWSSMGCNSQNFICKYDNSIFSMRIGEHLAKKGEDFWLWCCCSWIKHFCFHLGNNDAIFNSKYCSKTKLYKRNTWSWTIFPILLFYLYFGMNRLFYLELCQISWQVFSKMVRHDAYYSRPQITFKKD